MGDGADPLYDDPALAGFYDLDNDWGEDLGFCAALAEGAASVLDLGCGTGRLVAHLAATRRAVGADPAAAMLAVARSRAGAARAVWVQGDARTLDLGETFDLVTMTGHAFQTLLTAKDRAAALATIRRHLASGGRFVFDSREPAAREWEEWTPARSARRLEHPGLGPVEAWNDAAWDEAARVVAYETHYRTASGRTFSARSRIAFPPKAEIAEAIAAAGLAVERWLGAWDGRPWAPGAAEIIPIGRIA